MQEQLTLYLTEFHLSVFFQPSWYLTREIAMVTSEQVGLLMMYIGVLIHSLFWHAVTALISLGVLLFAPLPLVTFI